jgi:hypothetical protein
LADSILSGELPPVSEKCGVLEALREQEIAAAFDEDYRGAGRIHRAVEVLQKAEPPSRRGSERAAAKQRQLDAAYENYMKREAFWEQKLAEIDESFYDALDELTMAQEEELGRLEEYWASEGSMTKYVKASPKLLQMRSIQKRTVLVKEFDAALETKETADELQKMEEMNAEQRALMGMRNKGTLIAKKHEVQANCVSQRAQAIRAIVEKKRDKELRAIQRTIEHLERDLAEPDRARMRVHDLEDRRVMSLVREPAPLTQDMRIAKVNFAAGSNQGRLRVTPVGLRESFDLGRKGSRPGTPGSKVGEGSRPGSRI